MDSLLKREARSCFLLKGFLFLIIFVREYMLYVHGDLFCLFLLFSLLKDFSSFVMHPSQFALINNRSSFPI